MPLIRRTSQIRPKLHHEPSALLPDGTVVNYGDVLRIAGEPGATFRFRYARLGELTVYGGLPYREAWRTFRPEQVTGVSENDRAVALAAEAETADLSPGQKAALTRAIKAAAGPRVNRQPDTSKPDEWDTWGPGKKAAWTRRRNLALAST